MEDDRINEGIERFLKYIKRMNTLSNEQLRLLTEKMISQDPIYYTSVGITIEGHIDFVRQMALLGDNMIRKFLIDQVNVNKDPVWIELFEDAAKKKAILNMQKLAKDMKVNPKEWARKVA